MELWNLPIVRVDLLLLVLLGKALTDTLEGVL
jgi:hypothetical protein